MSGKLYEIKEGVSVDADKLFEVFKALHAQSVLRGTALVKIHGVMCNMSRQLDLFKRAGSAANSLAASTVGCVFSHIELGFGLPDSLSIINAKEGAE